MKKYTTILYITSILIISIFSFTGSSFAGEPVVIDSLTFKIVNIAHGQWSKPRHHMINDMVEHVDQGGEALSYIAISYTVTNSNKTKKIDLDGKFNYALFDNFGNRYRAMRKPDDFKASVLTVSKNFPSLYPNEVYGETLFFEAPLTTASNLMLAISGESLKLSRPVELAFSTEGVTPKPVLKSIHQPDSHRAENINIASPNLRSGEPEIRVLSPEPGTVWDQGQSTRIEIVSINGQCPKKIILIAFDTTFQDVAPQKSNIYDINIPLDTPPGSYTANVIAQWSTGEISSTFLPFYVKDSTPLGIL